MSGFPDECIDLTVTSPPYDNLRKYQGYTFDFEGIAHELYRITKPAVSWSGLLVMQQLTEVKREQVSASVIFQR